MSSNGSSRSGARTSPSSARTHRWTTPCGFVPCNSRGDGCSYRRAVRSNSPVFPSLTEPTCDPRRAHLASTHSLHSHLRRLRVRDGRPGERSLDSQHQRVRNNSVRVPPLRTDAQPRTHPRRRGSAQVPRAEHGVGPSFRAFLHSMSEGMGRSDHPSGRCRYPPDRGRRGTRPLTAPVARAPAAATGATSRTHPRDVEAVTPCPRSPARPLPPGRDRRPSAAARTGRQGPVA